MTLYRSSVCALALFVVWPVAGGGEAEARPRANVVCKLWSTSCGMAVTDDGAATSITATVKSDAGSEDVSLVESDAWLHGSAKIDALPKTDATLTVTLYDEKSASLMSFSGTLGTDGAATLRADETKETGTCDLSSKTGCTSDTSATTLDIEVLTSEVFGASGAYELGLDLAGADTYEVAYATVTVTESTEVTTCDKSKTCTTTGSSATTKSEVDWDEIGAVWEGELSMEPEGAIDVKVKSYDSKGEVVENTKVALGAPWIDGGEGVNVLAIEEDPLTTVGLLGRRVDVLPNGEIAWVASRLVVNSSGWTSTTAPVAAELELENGDTITIPVNSYQRGWPPSPSRTTVDLRGEIWGSNRITVTSGGTTVYDSSKTELGEPSCANGLCFRFIKDEGADQEYFVHSSSYGSDASKLPDDLDITITVYDKSGAKESVESATIEFDDEVTAVFANEVSFSEDPMGLDLSGEVSLLGAADSKGKQATLSKGKFFGAFSRDGDGDLNLAGADKNAGPSEGGVIVAGDAVSFELTDTNKDGVIDGPPIIAMYGDIIMGSMKLDDFND